MTNRPISPEAHGLLDYSLAGAGFALPQLFRLSPEARAVFRTFASAQAGVAAVTDQPYALERVVPFRVHRSIDRALLPAFLLAPFVAGIFRQRGARRLWLIMSGALAAVYFLTDWDAKPARRRGRRR